MNIYGVLLSFCWLIFGLYWFVAALTMKKRAPAGVRAVLIRVVAIFLILFVVLSTRTHISLAPVPMSDFMGTTGIALCAGGIAFAVWARKHLASNWGMPMTIMEKPELVMTGPYQYVRHPIYTGVITAIFGSAFVSGPWWLAVALGAVLYFAYSARQEEKVMLREFPHTYPAYKARTKMLIPFVV